MPRPAARPPSGTTCSRLRKKLSAGRCRRPHRQGQYSCRPHSYSTPAVSRHWPVFAVPGSCGKGNCPACALWAASVYMDFLSCVPPFSDFAVLPEKFSCPIPAACSGVGTLPTASGQLVPKRPLDTLSRSWLLAVLPPPDIPFRTVIRLSRYCPSMN